MITQEETNLILTAVISVVLLVVFFAKLFEIAKTLKEIRDKLPDKNTVKSENEKAPE